MNEENKRTTRGVALRNDLWEELATVAKEQSRSRSNLIEIIVLDYLRNYKSNERT